MQAGEGLELSVGSAPQSPNVGHSAEFGGRSPKFLGTGFGLLTLYVGTFLLSLFTLGIYSFWGRTKIRRYFANCTELEGEKLDYHGTGPELFWGWLKAAAVIGLLVLQAVLWVLVLGQKAGQVAGTAVLYIAITLLMPIAMVGTWRYRFSRTSYRGIRFSFRGRWQEFLPMYAGGVILTFLTASLYSPVLQNRTREFLCRNSFYGSARFGYDGESRPLVVKWLVALLLALPTLGLSILWYYAERFRHFWSHTTFLNARFRPAVTTGSLVWLSVSNLLLMVFTLFVATPWAHARSWRTLVDGMRIEGPLDLDSVRQEALSASSTGEGFNALLDHSGIDLGSGF